MDSQQSVVSSFKNLSVAVSGSETPKAGDLGRNSGYEVEYQRKESVVENSQEGSIGVLEVYIHQARDIHNICIYHKQDVYAKLCLTSTPQSAVSTKIINGGGKNPVFNENIRFDVKTIDASLKCEIWMLSRVRNYLEDQLLGFTLVPLSEIVIGNGSIAQEFSLSSTDLFHSPAGFVQLSLTYIGASPAVMAIPTPRASSLVESSEVGDSGISDSLEKIEFPDPNIVNENQIMVSQYFGIPCDSMESQSSEGLVGTLETDDNHQSSGVNLVESFAEASVNSVLQVPKPMNDTPASSVSTSAPASSPSFCDTPGATSQAPNHEPFSSPKENHEEIKKDENHSTTGEAPKKKLGDSVIGVSIELPEQTVVEQDIVDMYMKSMQQFTESLAKMKLPMDIENGSANNNGNGSLNSGPKLEASKSTGSKVFYGSRAFF
ncbi:hypothetical protein Scep_028925 [Stephania cephalantha]|uniref:C2 domain-containing protein n=1 Tax=Stephania cephalantha TaxID=152367 RepID=A0AAP0EI46_9MAGN